MTTIVLDEGTSDEKLYIGGGFGHLGQTSLENYLKLLTVYDPNSKTFRLCIVLISSIGYKMTIITNDISGKTVR